MELKLTNVARASLEELRLDYEDFLRQRSLTAWLRDDPRRNALVARRPVDADGVARWAMDVRDDCSSYPEIAANGALVLIAVTCALLDRQVAALAAAFEQDGGFTERLYRVRSERRKESARRNPGR